MGISATEVIERKMDGDKAYLWYYENLESNLDDMEQVKITIG